VNSFTKASSWQISPLESDRTAPHLLGRPLGGRAAWRLACRLFHCLGGESRS